MNVQVTLAAGKEPKTLDWESNWRPLCVWANALTTELLVRLVILFNRSYKNHVYQIQRWAKVVLATFEVLNTGFLQLLYRQFPAV